MSIKMDAGDFGSKNHFPIRLKSALTLRMSQPPRTPRRRIPAFAPVPVKRRADGWTPLRQAEFIGVLAETGSVRAAAEFVGMARETAYRLRRKPGAEEFARAWDIALSSARARFGWSLRAVRQAQDEREGADTLVPPKVSPDDLWRRIVDGRWRPVLHRGKYVGSVQKADNSALLSHIAQLDRGLRESRKLMRRKARSQARKNADLCAPARAARGGDGDRD